MNYKEQLQNLSKKYTQNFAPGGVVGNPGFGTKVTKQYKDENNREIVEFSDGKRMYTDSPEYQKLYSEGLLYGESPDKITYPQANANPEMERYKRIESENPFGEFVRPYFEGQSGAIARATGQSQDSLENMPEDYKKRYDESINKKWAEDVFNSNPQNEGETRGEYLNRIAQGMNPRVQKALYDNLPSGQAETLWQATGRGLENLISNQTGQGSLEERIQNNSSLSDFEKQRMLEDAQKNSYTSNIGTNFESLSAASIAPKLVQSMYRPNYSVMDALKGRQNDAGMLEDELTDPANYAGIGLISKFAKNFKKFNNLRKEVKTTLPLYDDFDGIPSSNHISIPYMDQPYGDGVKTTNKELKDWSELYRGEFSEIYGNEFSEKDLGLFAKRKNAHNIIEDPNYTDTFNNTITNQFMNLQGFRKESVQSPVDKTLIESYTRGYDDMINRRGSREGDFYSRDFYEKEIIPEFEDIVTRNKLTKNASSYRGTKDYELTVDRNGKPVVTRFSEMEDGDIFEPQSFVSTSLTPHTADTFGTVDEFKLPPGQSYLIPNAIRRNTYAKEDELVLPSKLKFKFEKIKEHERISDNGIEYDFGTDSHNMNGVKVFGHDKDKNGIMNYGRVPMSKTTNIRGRFTPINPYLAIPGAAALGVAQAQSYQQGGQIQEDWKQKYSTNPYFKDREDWGDKLSNKFPNGTKSVKDVINTAAKQMGVDPGLLYTSSMEEGMKLALQGEDTGERRAGFKEFRSKNPKAAQQYPIDGGYFYGLNTFGDKYGKIIKPSSFPAGYKFQPYPQTDPKTGEVFYNSAAFKSHDDAIMAKAGMMRQVEDAMNARYKKNNINLSPEAQKFFSMVGYNMGEDKTIEMIKSYEQKGYLKDDRFLDANFQPASWKEPYTNVQRRYQNYKILNEQGHFPQLPNNNNGQLVVTNKQSGGEVQNELQKTKDWWNRYLNSPKYLERLQKEFPDSSPEQVQRELEARKLNLEKTYPIVGEGHFKDDMSDASGYTTSPEMDERQYADLRTLATNFKEDYVLPSSRPVYVKDGTDSSTYNHEISHSVDESGRRIPLKTIAKLVNKVRGVSPAEIKRDGDGMFIYPAKNKETLQALSNIDNFYPIDNEMDRNYGAAFKDIKWKIGGDPTEYSPVFGYRGNPTEIIARLQPLREELYRKGIHDSATEDISKETLRKYIQETFEDEDKPIPSHLMDLLNEVKGNREQGIENLQWMLNNIAKRDEKNKKPVVAQKGGNVGNSLKNQLNALAQKFQTGGCVECEQQKMQKGGKTVAEKWEEATGTSWQEAKNRNLTDGSFQQNIDLMGKLERGELSNSNQVVSPQSANINFDNASTFNQAFSEARKTLGSNQIFTYKGKKFGTNIEGEAFTPSVQTLSQHNMIDADTNDRLNQQNKMVGSVYSTKKTVKVEPEYKDWDRIKMRKDELNKMKQADLIREFHKNSDEEYLVLDKAKGRMHLYKGDKEITSYSVGVGENKGDEQTRTWVDKSTKKTDWDKGNKQTGAGIYTVSGRTQKNKQFSDAPSWNFLNENGIEVPMAIHATETQDRLNKIKDNDPTNNRVSNGCINGQCNNLKDLYQRGYKEGQKLYVLPDNDENKYQYKNGKLVLSSTDNKVNRTVNTLKYKPIKIYMPKDKNDVDNKFAQTLVQNKKELMQNLKIDGDTYNDIALLSLGILGQESNFGQSSKYKIKENIPGVVSSLKFITGNNSNNSKGLTQIKFDSQNSEVQKMFKKYGVTKDNLNQPEKASLATVILLSHMYNNELKGTKLLKDSKVKWQDALLYLNQGKKSELVNRTATPDKNIYIKNIKNHMNKFKLKELD